MLESSGRVGCGDEVVVLKSDGRRVTVARLVAQAPGASHDSAPSLTPSFHPQTLVPRLFSDMNKDRMPRSSPQPSTMVLNLCRGRERHWIDVRHNESP